MIPSEIHKTAKLLQTLKDEGKENRWSYDAVLRYYLSIGGDEEEIEMEAEEE